jgi:hypothetical protein
LTAQAAEAVTKLKQASRIVEMLIGADSGSRRVWPQRSLIFKIRASERHMACSLLESATATGRVPARASNGWEKWRSNQMKEGWEQRA